MEAIIAEKALSETQTLIQKEIAGGKLTEYASEALIGLYQSVNTENAIEMLEKTKNVIATIHVEQLQMRSLAVFNDCHGLLDASLALGCIGIFGKIVSTENGILEGASDCALAIARFGMFIGGLGMLVAVIARP